MDEIFIVYSQTRLGGFSRNFTVFLTQEEAKKYCDDRQHAANFTISRKELVRPPKNRGNLPKKVYLTIDYDFEEDRLEYLLVSTSKMEAVKAIKPKPWKLCGVIEVRVNTKDN